MQKNQAITIFYVIAFFAHFCMDWNCFVPLIVERTQWLSAFLQKRMPNCQTVQAPASEE